MDELDSFDKQEISGVGKIFSAPATLLRLCDTIFMNTCMGQGFFSAILFYR